MATKDNVRKISLIVLCLAMLAAAIAVLLCGSVRALAEEPQRIALSPIAQAENDITYYCFENPTGIHADGDGLIVSGKSVLYSVTDDTDVAAERTLPSDKIYRHAGHGDHTEYLISLYNGNITLHSNTESDILSTDGSPINGIIDFAVEGDKLYAVTENSLVCAELGADAFAPTSVTVTELSSSAHTRVTVNAVAVANGKVYVAVNSVFGNKNDICTVADGALTVAVMQSKNVTAFTYSEDSGLLYALTRSDIAAYKEIAAGLVRTAITNAGQITAICAYGNAVYALDEVYAVHKLTTSLTRDDVIIASGSNAKGFLNTPSGVSAKNSNIYVADTVNNRVAIYGKDIKYVLNELYNPVSVVSDSAGTIYVAYEYNKIGVYRNGNLSPSSQTTYTDPSVGHIKRIAVDADKTLYVLADTGVWSVTAGVFSLLDSTAYKAITLSVGRDELYALSDTAVVKLDTEYLNEEDTAAKVCDAPSDAISLAVDLGNNVYMLTQNSVVKYNGSTEQEYALTYNDMPYTMGGSLGQIVMCTVQNAFADYGDVLIADTYRHRLLKATGSELGVKLIDDDYDVPDIAGDSSLGYYGDRIIRTATRDTEVFAFPMESQPIFNIAEGRKVIVPAYDLEDSREYSLVLIDDTETGKLVQGYVFKNALSDPLPYTQPPSSICTVFNAATPVYKWPSRNSKTVTGYSAVGRNEQFQMLDFVEGFRDDYGYLWYRIALDNVYEGYVLAVNISAMSYEPIYIRPSYDAEIISYKGSTSAPAYIMEDGKYIKVADLPTGTEVEVVGSFDSSERYTKVKYFDSELGTLTCYVETVYIEYNGVNVVLLVAIIVIVITVLLAAVIIGRVMHNKKKRLIGEDNENSRD